MIEYLIDFFFWIYHGLAGTHMLPVVLTNEHVLLYILYTYLYLELICII